MLGADLIWDVSLLEKWVTTTYYYSLWYIIHFQYIAYKLIYYIFSKCKNKIFNAD